VQGGFCRTEKQLRSIQKKENIPFMDLNDSNVANALQSAGEKKRQLIMMKLRKMNVERLFLANLIKKYPSK